jgi:hypothetical protein
MGWPQVLMGAFMIVQLSAFYVMERHKYSEFANWFGALLLSAIHAWLLYAGGFFG